MAGAASGSAALFACPLAVALDRRVAAQRVERREPLRKGQLVVESMDAAVAESADGDALLQLLACIVLAVVASPVHLARDQVVEGQRSLPAAQAAPVGFAVEGRHVRIMGGMR